MDYHSSYQPISWFTSQVYNGGLIIRPPFQRKPVWVQNQKSILIESVLLRLPIPEIYITTSVDPDGTTTHLVVDGQQRITSILEFVGAKGFEAFELTGLGPDSPWEGFTFADLTDDEKSRFYGYPLAVRFLANASLNEIKELFVRFNKNLTALNSQELRNAMFSGPFVQLAEEFADDPYWAENQIVDTRSIRRMKDIEFTSDLLIGVLHGPQSGNARTLDSYYERYEMEEQFPQPIRTKRIFTRALTTIQTVYPDIKSTRWHNRSDFYSLFVWFAEVIQDRKKLMPTDQIRQALDDFSDDVVKAQESQRPGQPLRGLPHVVSYVEALRRGSSDRTRRAARHKALETVFALASTGQP